MKLYHATLGPIGTNCYIAADPQGVAALIDPAAKADTLIGLIEEHQLTPTTILLTHGHYDHIGAVAGLCARFPEIQVYIGAPDDELALSYANGDNPMPAYVKSNEYRGLHIHHALSDGDVVEVGSLRFEVVHTPGHTLGGVCYLCEDYMFSGDTLFCREVGRTDLFGGDYATLLRSLKKLHDLPGDFTVLPGHERFSTLQEERDENHYMKEACQ